MASEFHLWSGGESEFTHEAEQQLSLVNIIQNWFKEKNATTHLLLSFWVGSEEIDAAVILPNLVVVIDLKSGSGQIQGTENGPWKCIKKDGSDFELNENRQNPLQQARKKRWAIINYLKERQTEIFPPQKASQVSFYHTMSLMVFDGEVEWDNAQVDEKVRPWFDVISLSALPEKLTNQKSRALNLTPQEAWKIPILLGLKNEDKSLEKTEPVVVQKKEPKVEIQTKETEIPVAQTETIDDESTSTEVETQIKEIEIPLGQTETIDDESTSTEIETVSGFYKGHGEANDRIIIKLSDEKEHDVKVNKAFVKSINKLEKLSKTEETKALIVKNEIDITLVNVTLEDDVFIMSDDQESFLVIEPRWLINVSNLTAFDFCERTLFTNRFTVPEQNEPMLRGSIVHEVFEKILDDPEDKEKMKEQLDEKFQNSVLDFALMDVDPGAMFEFIRPHLNELYKYRKGPLKDIQSGSVKTERYILNTTLGLKGKIDAIVERKGNENKIQALELKTGKSYGGNIKYGHAVQAQAYSMMLEMKYPDEILEPLVIYSGDHPFTNHLGKKADFDYGSKANVMDLRNKLVLADYLFSLDYATKEQFCKNCFQKAICYNLYNLELEHKLENRHLFDTMGLLPTDLAFQKEINDYTEQEKSFFYKYNRLITQEYRVVKEEHGNYLTLDSNKRLEEGKCVEISAYEEKKPICYLACENESEIREGDFCLLSDIKGPIEGECLEVVVTNVASNQISIKSRVSPWFEPIFLDKHDTESMIARNFAALYELLKEPTLLPIKSALLDESFIPNPNVEKKANYSKSNIPLNPTQERALNLAMGLEHWLLVQGPPGTGKTSVLAKMVEALLVNNKKILIACYTHRAVEEVLKKLGEVAPNVEVLRIGNPLASKEELDKYLLIEKVKQNGSDIDAQVENAEKIIDANRVYIGTTHAWLSGKFDKLLKEEEQERELFDVAIIDEAAQITIPSVIGALRLAKKFVLVGDHMQLPPVVKSEEASRLKETLFEKLFDKEDEQTTNNIMLDIQYRMHPAICEFISKEFYDGKLKSAPEVENRKLELSVSESQLAPIITPDKPLVLVHLSTDAAHQPERQSKREIDLIVEILRELRSKNFPPDKIGIIAPFRAQVAALRRAFEKLYETLEFEDIRKIVDTVDRFQGDEKDIIIFSLTITSEEIPMIFQEKRRLNVAISRTKSKFIGIGDWNRAEKSPTLSHLKDYAISDERCSFIDWDEEKV